MERDGKTFLVCNCEGTLPLDGRALAKACGGKGEGVSHQLCRAEIETFKRAVAEGRPLVVACTQEAPLFAELAGELAPELPLSFANIRETAGWSAAGGKAGPKIAALLAAAAIEAPASAPVTMKSAGLCLVYGRDETAIEAARRLKGRLDVTVLLDRPGEVLPPLRAEVPLFKGSIVTAKGHLGAFEIVVDGYAPAAVSSRGQLAFEVPRNGAASRCDLILDLSGGTPLFSAGERRDGYFRPDPNDAVAVERALFALTDLVGEFDKPRYIAFHAELCAHSRSRKTGCMRCLEVCPVGAITPAGDTVAIDPFICGGCGACHSVCPTGAADYALPPSTVLLARLRTLLATYRAAGGDSPALLLHDERHGVELIAAMSRLGRGLPANLLPLQLNEVTQVGFELVSAAFAYGAAQVVVLVPPKRAGELAGLAQQVGLAEALLAGLGYGGGRVEILVEADPDVVESALWSLAPRTPPKAADYLPLGGKRSLQRLALTHLHEVAPEPVDTIGLPPGAPFGRLAVDTEGCTLCLACVSACPTGALQDNPERPQLRFQEEACIQCGLCAATCPEKVIRLEPRLSFAPSAREAVIVKEEEPFHCLSCGKPFGTRSSIERIATRLEKSHPLFQTPEGQRRLRLCETCRVVDQFESGKDPFTGPPRPRTRTTDDYLREREIEEARAKVKAEQREE